MIHINFRAKFFRVVGYVFCAVMLAVCILLIVAAAGFGSREVVNVFGYNIYIVQAEGFNKAPKGSAVIVKKASAFGIESGKLILYEKGGEGEQYALGYVKEPHVADGVYYLTVTDNVSIIEVPEVRLVGTADYSSEFVGSVINFIKTPFGIFCIAVMPCVALVLYDFIRASAKNRPEPEVEPQIKNTRGEVVTQKNISVKGDGKAAYSRTESGGSAAEADGVLFNYSPKKQKKEETSKNERPIIPLTDRTSPDVSRNIPKTSEIPRSGGLGPAPKQVNPGVLPNMPKTPDTVGISRYIGNSQNDSMIRNDQDLQDKTAELPKIGKNRDPGDAFFAQTTSTSAVIHKNGEQPTKSSKGVTAAPQIGRQLSKRPVSELNEEESNQRGEVIPPPRTSGRRSTQILASKRVSDLIDDDDDVRGHGNNRSNDSIVDDIIAGINNHNNS